MIKLLFLLEQQELLVYLKNALEISNYFCDNLCAKVINDKKSVYFKGYNFIIFDNKDILQSFFKQHGTITKYIYLKPLGFKDNIFNNHNIIELFYPSKQLLSNIKQQISL